MDNAFSPEDVTLPLSERFPVYLGVFGLGFVVATLAGAVWGAAAGSSIPTAVAYSLMLYGVLLLLIGGATGGGYTNIGLGAVGSIFGGRHLRHDDSYDDPDVRRGAMEKMDLQERLRKGLRPQANPTAFWQVIGGIAYVALGVGIVEVFG